MTLPKSAVACALVILFLLPALTRAETAVQAWVQRCQGLGSGADPGQLITSVAVDSSNNVIVAGSSETGPGSICDYSTIKYSSAGTPLWTNRYNGPGHNDDQARAVAVDGSDNVVVAGYSYGSYGYRDYATIKYSAAGVPIWTNRHKARLHSDEEVTAMAVDSSDSVIVTGYSDGGYGTIKYSSAGLPLWTNRYDGPGTSFNWPCAVAVDGSNNVIVTGTSQSGTTSVYATIKYSDAGVPLWTNRYRGWADTFDWAYALAVDSSNNVIVTGYTTGHPTETVGSHVTIKYSSSGVPLWTNRCDGRGNDNIDSHGALAVDSSDNIIIAGSAWVYGSDYNYLVTKYSSAGVPLWTNRYNGPGNDFDWTCAVAVDASNSVIVAGHSVGSGTTNDFATIKYSSAGVPLWTNRYDGPGNGPDLASAVAADRNGNVIVTGHSVGSSGEYDFATIKYLCIPSPVMTGVQRTNGTFQMRVDDVLQPGTLVIEASTNLAGWVPVFTNTTPTNVLIYTDPDAGTHLRRFYRAFQFP